MPISAFMITRNHENCIEKAIKSLTALNGEVLICDTGSTDDTPSVCHRLGVKVVNLEWKDDFAAACNSALSQCQHDWILQMNPDEEVVSPGVEILNSVINDQQAFAYYIKVDQLLTPSRTDAAAANELRLYTKNAQVQYIGRLYPRFVTPIEDTAAANGKVVGLANVTMLRHAYLSPVIPDKVRWNCRLLELELQDRPGQIDYLIEYGRNLLLLGDIKGHAVLSEASKLLQPLLEDVNPPCYEVGKLIEYRLNVSEDLNKTELTSAQAKELATKWFAQSPPVMWALAAHHFQRSEYAHAATHLESLIRMGETGEYDPRGGFEPAIIRQRARFNLAACHIQLGNVEAARVVAAPLLFDNQYRNQTMELFGIATNNAQ